VEDKDRVRTVAANTLREAGDTVLEARNGEEAADLCAGLDDPIHLLLTDVIMPGSNGRRVAEQITAVHPGMGVLFMSGDTDDAVLRLGVLGAKALFLQQPFTPCELWIKVRETLARVGGEAAGS
jgi:DNA-binding response OmpR family regulator